MSADKAVYTIELNDRLSPGLKKAVANTLGFDQKMGGVSKKAKKGGKSLGILGASFSRLVPVVALATAGIKAFSFASDSINEARKFESLTNAIEFASGSAKAGAQNMKFLSDTAKELGTPLLASTEGFKQFSAATMGSKIAGEQTRTIFRQVSMATTALGLSADDSKGVFLALSQMMSKGKVSAEELRQQLGERLPGAFQAAARATGLTDQKFNKLLETGRIGSEEFLPRFANELEKTYGKALPKAVESSQAKLNRFNNQWLKIKVTVGNLLLPVINSLMGAFQKVVNFFMRHKDTIINEVFNPIKDIIKTMFSIYAELFNAVAGGFGKTMTFSEAFKASLLATGKVLKWVAGIAKTTLGKIRTLTDSISIGIIVLRSKFVQMGTVLSEIFGGIADSFSGLADRNFDKIEKGRKRMLNARRTGAAEQKKFLKEELALFLKGKNAVKSVAPKSGTKSTVSTFTPFTPLDGKGGTGKASSSSVDGIKSGRPTHINIDIGKLIENMNITASNIDDLTGQIKDQVAAALFSAVNNVNNIAGT